MDIKLEKIDDYRWLIPKTGSMRVPGLIFSNAELINAVREDQSLTQVANVATLPGIVGHALAMPDIHWGYAQSVALQPLISMRASFHLEGSVMISTAAAGL